MHDMALSAKAIIFRLQCYNGYWWFENDGERDSQAIQFVMNRIINISRILIVIRDDQS